MLSIENRFEKGEKALTISDKNGVFEIIEVEVYGHVYQDIEKDKPPVILYVFDLQVGENQAPMRKFANPDIMFKTREEAIKKLQEMWPQYEKGYADEVASMVQNMKNLEDHQKKLRASALLLIEEIDPVVSAAPAPQEPIATPATEEATTPVENKPLPNEQ